MNILILGSLSAWDAVTGGMENYITEVSERLAKRHNVHVIVNNNDKGSLKSEEKINRVSVYRLGYSRIGLKRMLIYPLDYYRIAKKIIEENDIEIIHSLASYPMGYIACRLGKKFNIPSLISIRNTIPSYMNTVFIKRHFLNYTFKNATGLHTASNYLKEQVKFFFRREALTVYNGVDIKPPGSGTKKRIRNKYGLKFPTIICVSHYRPPQKRQDILVRAGKGVIEKYPEMKILFIGRGFSESILSLARGLGLDNNILFLGGKPRNEIPLYLSVSDVFALPTLFEGLPNAVLEALAMGVPVVATKTGSLPEVVENDIDGKLVPLSAEGFAEGILDLLSDRKRLNTMGSSGVRKTRKFTWENTARGIETEMIRLVKK